MPLLKIIVLQRERLCRVDEHEIGIVAGREHPFASDPKAPRRRGRHQLREALERQAPIVMSAIDQDGQR